MKKLTGKFALVTGASRGIGKAIALAFARERAALILAARSADALREVAESAAEVSRAEAIAVVADVSDESQVEALFARVKSEFGKLDLLVNNAGAFDGGPLDQLSTEAWDRVIHTNLRGPFLCTRAALQLMKPARSGRIINIGSIASQRTRVNAAAYTASKHGLWGLTQATALEGREYGVTCGAVHPGNVLVERRVGSSKIEDAEPMMTPDEVAEVALLMATLPPHVELLEAIVLPHQQLYVGRG